MLMCSPLLFFWQARGCEQRTYMEPVMQTRTTTAARQPAIRRRAPRKLIGAPVQKKYITRRDAATYLGCSPKHVAFLVMTGQLPEHKFGKFTRRYTIADLDAFAEARRKGVVAK